MKRILSILVIGICIPVYSQDYVATEIDKEVVSVQPMTGIVFWPHNSRIATDAISIEYSYMAFSDVVSEKGVYDWTVVEALLDEIASRNHQAILRYRYSYPGRTTTVPQYIKDLPDYSETEGLSEGNNTYFPDWSHDELKRFTLEFHEKFAERYDTDPRLAFLQVGFGLWAEYHIYSGPFELGKTFPDKEFQKIFFNHLNSTYQETYWSISIDAASGTYSPFSIEPDLKNIVFGLFDDSFMHSTHAGYNTTSWNFFNRERYKTSPAGGEFSYYSNFDQSNVLNAEVGNYGTPYEIFAQNFHISYMIGNDQSKYQTLDRIKEASMYSGYIFKLNSFLTKPGSSIVEVVNLGVAPIYINAYITVDGIRSTESLKLLAPDEIKTFNIDAGGDNAVVTIESDDILDTQTIEFFGTVNDYTRYVQPEKVLALVTEIASDLFTIYPNPSSNKDTVRIDYSGNKPYSLQLYNIQGKLVLKKDDSSNTTLNTSKLKKGLFILIIEQEDKKIYQHKLIVN